VIAMMASGVLAACSNSAAPADASRSAMLEARAGALAVANATVHVLSGADSLQPAAINDSDEVVGTVAFQTAGRWTPTAGFVLLPGTANHTSSANAVNDNGAIAGSFDGHPAVWLNTGSVRILQKSIDSGTAGSGFDACRINGTNVWAALVGNCTAAGGAFSRAMIFEWHGIARSVDPGGGDVTSFIAISRDGFIAGEESMGSGGFIQTPTGQIDMLRNHSGVVGLEDVTSITDHGFSAGESFEGGCWQAVAWLGATGQTYPEFRLGTCGKSYGLTHDWYVVGTATDTAGNNPFAFVWFPEKGLQRLPGLGATGEQSAALAISERHHVVGTVTSAGRRHTVIWDVGPR
jgi:hypothetical protein